MENGTCSTEILTFLPLAPHSIFKFKKKANMSNYMSKVLMEARILEAIKHLCSHWESEMLWVLSTHQDLSIYPNKRDRSFASSWVRNENKDHFKANFSFAWSLLNHVSQQTVRFVTSIRAEMLHLKVGSLRIVLSLRWNDFGLGNFGVGLVFWRFSGVTGKRLRGKKSEHYCFPISFSTEKMWEHSLFS